MKGSELERFLKKNGCYFLQDGTNHEIWYSPVSSSEFLVPRHRGQEVPTGTFYKILKDAGIKK